MEKVRIQRKIRRRRNTIKAWALLSPSILFMTMFTFYPFVKTFVLSFYKKKLTRAVRRCSTGFRTTCAHLTIPGFRGR